MGNPPNVAAVVIEQGYHPEIHVSVDGLRPDVICTFEFEAISGPDTFLDPFELERRGDLQLYNTSRNVDLEGSVKAGVEITVRFKKVITTTKSKFRFPFHLRYPVPNVSGTVAVKPPRISYSGQCSKRFLFPI